MENRCTAAQDFALKGTPIRSGLNRKAQASMLEKSGPTEESGQRGMVSEDELKKPCWGNLMSMKETALLVADAVRLHPPAQQWRAPRGKEKWPRQAKCNNQHSKRKPHRLARTNVTRANCVARRAFATIGRCVESPGAQSHSSGARSLRERTRRSGRCRRRQR